MKDYCEFFIKKEKKELFIIMLAALAGTFVVVPIMLLTALHNGTMGIGVCVVILGFIISTIFVVIRYIRLMAGTEETVFVKSIRNSMMSGTLSLEEVFQEINRDLSKDFGNVLIGDKWLVGFALCGKGYQAVRLEQIESFSYARLQRRSDNHSGKKVIRIYLKQRMPLSFRPPGENFSSLYSFLQSRYPELEGRKGHCGMGKERQ